MTIHRGLGSDPCVENFWSAACWFGTTGAQSLGIDIAPGTIPIPSPLLSKCAGTINSDGSCTPVPSVNDPNNTAGIFTPGNIQKDWSKWAADMSASANVPQSNTSGSGWLWLIVGAIALMSFNRR